MKTIADFWKENNIEVSDQDNKFLENIWNSNVVPKTNEWYSQLFEYLGKDGTNQLLSDNIASSFTAYKNFLGKKRHLDVGSGTGLTPLLISTNKSLPVEMIDVYNDEIVEEVKRVFSADFHFTVYKSGESLPFLDNTFDSASILYVLHHCKSRETALQLLKEIYRVLDTNSHLIVIDEPVETPEDRKRMDNLDAIINSYYASKGFDQEKGFDVANFYTKSELEQQFVEAGFEIATCIEDLKWSWLLKRSLYILSKK